MNNYLDSYKDYFWEWKDQNQVVEVVGGSTIAYNQTIVDILKTFNSQPFPSFGSLLLVIAATNESLSDDLSIVEQQLRTQIARHPFESPIELTNILEDAIRFLRMVTELPEHIKTNTYRKKLIVALFEGAHNLVSNSRLFSTINNLKNESPASVVADKDFSIAVFRKDFRPLAMMVEKFQSVEGILDHLSGIPDLKEELLLDTPERSGTNTGDFSFLDQLIKDPNTFQIGSLIKRIWSGLSIPYHLSIPSGQPLGGFSDITNKGDFDKILISEFANDDIVLLSRLANSEALFLRREEPPSDEEFERVILVDVSIRNWGTPKLLAYALLIAIANHPKTDITCTGYAVGSSFSEIRWGSVEEVTESLNRVDPALHPAQGLSKFLKEYKSDKNVEVFYISSKEAVLYPEMQSVLNEHHSFFKYWINVSSQGEILLYKNQFKAKRLIQDIKLPLEELWRKAPNANDVNIKKIPTDELPLFMPFSSNYIANIKLDNQHGLIVTRNRDLLKFKKGQVRSGLKFITHLEDVTKDTLFAAGVNNSSETIIVCYVPNQKKIHVFNLVTKEHKKFSYLNFSVWSTQEIIYFNEEFYLMGKYSCYQLTYEPSFAVNYIAKVPEALKEYYNSPRYGLGVYCDNVLQNIKTISINNVGNLIFNGLHELRVIDNKVLRLERSKFMFGSIASKESGKTKVFEFPEGSTIEASKLGFMKFNSSSVEISEFYIPTALNMDLAIVTNDKFSGNEYFENTDTKNNRVDLQYMNSSYLQAFIENITKQWN